MGEVQNVNKVQNINEEQHKKTKARVSRKEILIQIHCQEQKQILESS